MPLGYAAPDGFGAGADQVTQAMEKSADRRLHAAALQQQAQAHQDQMEMERDRMGQQASQFAQSRQPSSKDAWEQQAHVQSALAINKGQLSQAENMRLQRLQQAGSSVDEALSRGDVTPEQANEMRFQIQGLTGPMELRRAQSQAAAQAAMQREQLTHLTNQNAVAQTIRIQNEQAANGNDQVTTRYHPGVLGRRTVQQRSLNPNMTQEEAQNAARHK